MKARLRSAACAIVLSVIPFSTVYGSSIQVDFDVTNFAGGAPSDPVAGTIIYEADSPTADIDSLTSITLDIGSHTYTLAELGFISPWGSGPVKQIIGGNLNGVNVINTGTNDFWLQWDKANLTGLNLSYTIAENNTTAWGSTTFTSFSVTSVPLPPTLWLFGSGLIGLIGMARKKAA